MRSDPASEARANIQFHVQPLSLDKFGEPLHRFAAITLSACNLRPTSRGSVRIKIHRSASCADDRASVTWRPIKDRTIAADYPSRATRRLAGPAGNRLGVSRRRNFCPVPHIGDDDAFAGQGRGRHQVRPSFILVREQRGWGRLGPGVGGRYASARSRRCSATGDGRLLSCRRLPRQAIP